MASKLLGDSFFSVILSEAKNLCLCGVNNPEEREGKAFDV
jgi:hypothetical protein